MLSLQIGKVNRTKKEAGRIFCKVRSYSDTDTVKVKRKKIKHWTTYIHKTCIIRMYLILLYSKLSAGGHDADVKLRSRAARATIHLRPLWMRIRLVTERTSNRRVDFDGPIPARLTSNRGTVWAERVKWLCVGHDGFEQGPCHANMFSKWYISFGDWVTVFQRDGRRTMRPWALSVPGNTASGPLNRPN